MKIKFSCVAHTRNNVSEKLINQPIIYALFMIELDDECKTVCRGCMDGKIAIRTYFFNYYLWPTCQVVEL